MQPASKPSALRVTLTWLAVVATIVVIIILSFMGAHGLVAPKRESDTETPAPNAIVHFVFYFVVGGFFLAAGVASYLVTVFTGCFTFNYKQPVWNAVKTKQYVANIVVGVGAALGLGFMLSAFLSPVLTGFGLDAGIANVAPLIVALIGFQLMQLWVLIWSPVERRTIVHRLTAMGITPEHLRGATLVGLSNPASGLTKRFAAIEEDMGALWITPELLMFRGDGEQFDFRRDQIAQIERRMDGSSTTALAGITHTILHVRLPDGRIRQIRLHVEGVWTMGQKKHAVNALADAIESWHANPA